ncbi:MAG: hypothetical protein JSS02_03215, partial [Planctomycetes bacterium]|nr:hypothetical protein [Planctomycetota bacterium]
MYLNPIRDFVRKFTCHGLLRQNRLPANIAGRRVQVIDRTPAPFNLGAELFESRAMLSGPALIQVQPNIGTLISVAPQANTVETVTPNQLTFTFSPGAAIDATTLSSKSLFVTRAGADMKLGSTDDIPVPIGNYQVDPNHGNQVVVRFQDTLPDDLYQITITGALKDTTKASFNGGVTQNVNFQVDFGSQVVSVVPQPVVRGQNLTINDPSQVYDGATFTIKTAGTPVTFQFQNTLPLVGNNVGVAFTPGDSLNTITSNVVTAINGSSLAGTFGGALTASSSTPGSVQLTSTAFSPLVSYSTSSLSVLDAAKITNLDAFTLTSGSVSKTFQFKQIGTIGSVDAGNIAINYSAGATASTLATSIASAINGSALGASVTATANGSAVFLTANPSISLALTDAGFLAAYQDSLSVADGTLNQMLNTINVYFNQNPISAAIAEDPAFYQIISESTGTTLEPVKVTYNASGFNAVLQFTTLPSGAFRLQIGAPKVLNNTTASATNVGTLFSSLDLQALAGTTTWTNGSNVVTGTGTLFTTLKAGQILQDPDGNFYTVQGIGGNTSLTLTTTYLGSSASGQTTYTPLTFGKLSPIAGTTFWSNGQTLVTGVDTHFNRLLSGQIL